MRQIKRNSSFYRPRNHPLFLDWLVSTDVYLSLRAAARLIGVSAMTMSTAKKDGKIPYTLINDRPFIHEDYVHLEKRKRLNRGMITVWRVIYSDGHKVNCITDSLLIDELKENAKEEVSVVRWPLISKGFQTTEYIHPKELWDVSEDVFVVLYPQYETKRKGRIYINRGDGLEVATIMRSHDRIMNLKENLFSGMDISKKEKFRLVSWNDFILL